MTGESGSMPEDGPMSQKAVAKTGRRRRPCHRPRHLRGLPCLAGIMIERWLFLAEARRKTFCHIRRDPE